MSSNKEQPATPPQNDALGIATKCLYIFGTANGIVLAVLIVTAVAGGSANTFMWVRGVILAAMVPVFAMLIRSTRRGSASARDRLRLIMTVLPVAIVVVDLIPGLCPWWYAGIQGVGGLALVAPAVMLWRESSRGTSLAGE